MEQRAADGEHQVQIVNRERVLITGVLHVDSFDDQEVILDTDLGVLTIRGEDLHIRELSLEQGSFAVDGGIMGLQYSAAARGKKGKGSRRGGLLDRLLR